MTYARLLQSGISIESIPGKAHIVLCAGTYYLCEKVNGKWKIVRESPNPIRLK